MSMQVTFLGTAASIPTNTRGLSAVAIQRKGELLLFDCGEGTQRQMIRAKLGFNKKTKVFVTHMHGDHVLGLPGLLQTMSLLGRDKPLQVFGPEGISAFIEAAITTIEFSLAFPVTVHEIGEEGPVLREKEYEMHAAWAEHSVPCLAYALVEKPRPGRFHPERAKALGVPKGPLWHKIQQGSNVELPDGRTVQPREVLDAPRPGRKIVVVSDTKPSDNIVRLAEGADMLVHEATFAEDMVERAGEDLHSTPAGAASVAEKAGAKWLILTHISARYGDTSVLLDEARKVFAETVVAEDFMRIIVPLKES